MQYVVMEDFNNYGKGCMYYRNIFLKLLQSYCEFGSHDKTIYWTCSCPQSVTVQGPSETTRAKSM